MKVLSVTSEIYPLIKTGGLADVAGALPIALKSHGIETRTLVPGYPDILTKLSGSIKKCGVIDNLLGVRATLWQAHFDGLDLLILDAPSLYQRSGGPYLDPTGIDYPDNWKRYAAFSLAAAQISMGLLPNWKPDIVHAHDWQAALTPLYMKFGEGSPIPSLVTIHNIAFQGQFGANIFSQMDLPAAAFSTEYLEYYNDISFLKGGLQTASAITTVSPTYAQEIQTAQYGMGLEGVIAHRAHALQGIVNGIDTDTWDPDTDQNIKGNYSESHLENRAVNKRAIEAHFQLETDESPIFCIISRLTWQKGIDLVVENIETIVNQGARLVILGAGDQALEYALKAAASHHKGRVGVTIGYDEALSHLMQAGSDAIIIPSRFEPCGLTQLYALRYGCIPIVARTGGLNDTIIDANHAALSAKVATGIQFTDISVHGLKSAIHKAIELYHTSGIWTQMQKQGMKSDISWEKSAAIYAALYKQIR